MAIAGEGCVCGGCGFIPYCRMAGGRWMPESDASVLVGAKKYANDLLTVAVYMVAADESERLVSWHASIEEADKVSEALRSEFPTHWFLVKEGA